MPSDERVNQVFEALAGQRDAFRAALGTTADQVDHFIAEHGTSPNGTKDRVAVELGPFASNRIDVERFSSFFTSASLDGRVMKTIENARDTIRELAALDHQLFLVDVAPGENLTAGVAEALEQIGLAFGAARMFDQARSGASRKKSTNSLRPLPFPKWSQRERALAPPLVVTVDGADLKTGGLGDFLDGSQKIVLIVRGDAPPAPLVRLITPGVFVVQAHSANGLDRFAAWDGPGVAALMPETAARFVHDPGAGTAPSERLTIGSVPSDPTRPVGGVSVRQQLEELRQLTALGAGPGAVAAGRGESTAGAPTGVAPADAPADPVDKLAAWLLNQADLTDVS
ncbi:MAG: hypothetical protein HKM89_15900 [Gemmatimonadales bacterium]|nr:hypothetical protein [Gemmatimonadales bacterium]